jgi:hypothetical protein
MYTRAGTGTVPYLIYCSGGTTSTPPRNGFPHRISVRAQSGSGIAANIFRVPHEIQPMGHEPRFLQRRSRRMTRGTLVLYRYRYGTGTVAPDGRMGCPRDSTDTLSINKEYILVVYSRQSQSHTPTPNNECTTQAIPLQVLLLPCTGKNVDWYTIHAVRGTTNVPWCFHRILHLHNDNNDDDDDSR